MSRAIFICYILICSSFIYSQNVYTNPDSYYYKGKEIKFYDTDSIIISLLVNDIKYYGNYYSLNISLLNKTNRRFDLFPEEIKGSLINKKGKKENMILYNYDDFYRRVRQKQSLMETFASLALVVSSFSSIYTPSNTSEYYVNGRKIGEVRSYNSTSIDDSWQRLRERREDALQGINNYTSNYLRRHTLFPKDELSGVINLKYKFGSKVKIQIPIMGDIYEFEYYYGIPVKDTDDVYYIK